FGNFSTNLDYGRYAAQPELGWPFPREGLLAGAKYSFADHWTVNGGVVFDMSRHFYDTVGQQTPVFFAPSYGVSLAYGDDCTTIKLAYSNVTSDPVSTTVFVPPVHNQTILLQITLRTLGEVQTSTGIGGVSGLP